MTHIILNHSPMDTAFARKLAATLHWEGAVVWLDIHNAPPAMNWQTDVEQGVREADIMLVIVTRQALESYVIEERTQAFMDRGKPVLYLALNRHGIEPFIANVTTIDFQKQRFEDAFRELKARLQEQGVALSGWQEAAPIVDENRDAAPQTVSDPVPQGLDQRRVRQIMLVLGVTIIIFLTGTTFVLLNPSAAPAQNASPTVNQQMLDEDETLEVYVPVVVNVAIIAENDVILLAEPHAAADVAGLVRPGTLVDIDARDASGTWVRLKQRAPNDDEQWLRINLVAISGAELASLPVLRRRNP